MFHLHGIASQYDNHVGLLHAKIGEQRFYDTMAEIVTEGYPSTSEWAVIATGDNFPDALAASALAASTLRRPA